MAAAVSLGSIPYPLKTQYHCCTFQPTNCRKLYRIRCNGQNSSSNSSAKRESEPQNALLKVVWYGSELLGIAASFLRSPSNVEMPQKDLKLARDGSEAVDRAIVVETIKEDFARSYFVTGDLTLDAYEEDCEFADPAGSFKGLHRFKRNCTNFGLLINKSNMKLIKWEDFEDKGIGHWRFSCIMSFPWRPILSGMFMRFASMTNADKTSLILSGAYQYTTKPLKASLHEIQECLHPLLNYYRL